MTWGRGDGTSQGVTDCLRTKLGGGTIIRRVRAGGKVGSGAEGDLEKEFGLFSPVRVHWS